jgi:hypothetical protein
VESLQVTKYIFTVTQDNAAPNNSMLEEFEVVVEQQCNAKPDNLQQPWSFTQVEGDVRSIGHVINLAVQAALKTLKAKPVEGTETY